MTVFRILVEKCQENKCPENTVNSYLRDLGYKVWFQHSPGKKWKIIIDFTVL
jgi:hypothetical protein